ncbi:MAG: nickel-type superoxide dismutase maturation protease [Candidatus Altiarchaeota archaeon]|nr:nickel-type superoxide dismutase maturation protease [Candidatus Altiarchaeota archaeon]
MIEILKVKGSSMSPYAREGDFVLIFKFFKTQKNCVVVAKDPRDHKLLMKRVYKVTKKGIELRGDNKLGSTDSRHFGLVQKSDVLGRVIKVFRQT